MVNANTTATKTTTIMIIIVVVLFPLDSFEISVTLVGEGVVDVARVDATISKN